MDYPNAESTTRELTTTTRAKLDWGQLGGIPGVKLDGTGYLARSSCVAGNGCYWASLGSAPSSTLSVNQMPTTGAPEGLSTIGLMAVGLALGGVLLVSSRRVRD